VAAVLVLALPACADPVAAYREEGSQAVQAELSGAQTVRMSVEAWLAGDLSRGTALVLVDEAGEAVGAAESGFAEQLPPQGAGALRAAVTDALTAVADDVESARIALHLDDRASAAAAVAAIDESVAAARDLGVRLR
jgi:hypothetical protein